MAQGPARAAQGRCSGDSISQRHGHEPPGQLGGAARSPWNRRPRPCGLLMGCTMGVGGSPQPRLLFGGHVSNL